MSLIYKNKLLCNHMYQYAILSKNYVIMLKFLSDQIIS